VIMEYKILYIIVEGNDDERFFDIILKPVFEERDIYVTLVKYSKNWKKARRFIRSIQRRNVDYIYIEDIDNAPCITGRKQKIKEKIENIDEAKIIIVVKEIESWYLAGLDENACRQLRIPNLGTTDNIFKERFIGLKPKKFVSTIDFMLEILKFFDIETAKHKNESFRYFCGKYL
jgi:hypothetical protein